MEPYEAGLWSYPAQGLREVGAGWSRALVEHCVARYGATHVRGWLWELWNEPDISYWRGTPEQFYALYDVTAASREGRAARCGRSADPPRRAISAPGGGATVSPGLPRPLRETAAPLDFVVLPHQGRALHPVARVRAARRAGARTAVALDSQDAARGAGGARCRGGTSGVFRDLPCIVDECDASVPAHWGVYDNANFAYRNTEYFPVFQCKLMKKLLDLRRDRSGAQVDQATTWSFYFEGERFFEGTRSLFTAPRAWRSRC